MLDHGIGRAFGSSARVDQTGDVRMAQRREQLPLTDKPPVCALAEHLVRTGGHLHELHCHALPDLAIDMVGIGERSGSLREMLDEVATFYDAESEVKLEQLTTTLEPAILVVMGGIVVTILLAIYLPIIQSISNGPMLGH